MNAMLAIIVSAAAMTLIVGARYLLASGAFALATRIKHPGLYAGLDPQIRREILWSLASAAIYGIPAGLVAWAWQNLGWTRIYTDLAVWPLWYWPVSIFLYLVAHDSWFYWTHRWMHRPALFRIAHAVHHASRPPTAGGGADDHDGDGRHQSHGLGNMADIPVARPPGRGTDYGQPPSKASCGVQV
jgi:sterol desaturase/sphingolipid hydroxylase (fatty acid hydroxylase superfamily)